MSQAALLSHAEGTIPALVLWEACREGDPQHRSRDTLSTLEAVRLLNEVRCFGRVPLLFVGRPLRRGDLGVLIEHGSRIGLALRLAPGPDELTAERAESLRDEGLARVVLDADARPWPSLLEEVGRARRFALGVHVTQRVTAALLAELDTLGHELAHAGVHVWTLSFPTAADAPTVRGDALDDALHRIVTAAAHLPLHVELEGAPQLERVVRQSGQATMVSASPSERGGVLYVGADGTMLPSPHLPLVLGNVRHEDVVDAFVESPVLCALRDPSRLQGKCGRCEYADVCGGSRARAHAHTGDWLAPDPACTYRPACVAAEEQPA